MKLQIMTRCAIAGFMALSATGVVHAGTVDEVTGVETSALPSEHTIVSRLASSRVPFIENRGQLGHEQVSFYARMFAGSLFVTQRGDLVYALPRQASRDKQAAQPVLAFRERFNKAQPANIKGEKASNVRVSHFMGPDAGRWQGQLHTWDSLDLGERYPGIRVSLRAAGNNVEKLFHVAPGADPAHIDMVIEGINFLDINEQGQLRLGTNQENRWDAVVLTAPLAYQDIDGKLTSVDVAYVLHDDDRYGFRVADYDRDYELVIDPLLASTYLGGENPDPPGNYDDDIIHGIVFSGDEVYVAGATQSPDFPVNLGYDDTLDSAYPDGFITRLSGDLSTVVSSTYLGTEYFDHVTDIAQDADGSIVVVGQAGYGFPLTEGAYNWSGTTPTGGGFIARFSADLSTLITSSIVTPSDYPARVALGNGGVYFGGGTNNPDFPITAGAYLDTCCPPGGFGIREYDGFAGKLSADMTTLEAMTYLGGDTVSGISVAPDGNVFITDGSDHAITGYIARMDAGLTTRSAYLSYYPGSQSGSSRTYFNDVIAGNGFVVTAGQTYMNDLPVTPGAFDATCGSDGECDGIGPLLVPRPDGFIAVYSADLQQTLALSYFGGSHDESIRELALAANGDILVSGETTSVDFPLSPNAADSSCGNDGQCDPTGTYSTPTPDGFIASLSPDLSLLHYASYLGGSGEDRPGSLALNDADQVYVAGYTRSLDFPTIPGGFDNSYNGGTSDAFISLLDTAGGSSENQPPIADAGTDLQVAPQTIVFLNGSGSSDPDGSIASYRWTQVHGKTVRLRYADEAVASFRAPNVGPGAKRVLGFQLDVTDDQGATASDLLRIDVVP
jgi:hypothetical protein